MSAYGPYELLRTLIARVSWPNEAEMHRALESVAEYESINMFGNLARQMACPHEHITYRGYPATAKCDDCERIM